LDVSKGRVRYVVEETQVLRHDDERCGLPIGVELNLDPKDHLDDVLRPITTISCLTII